MHITHKKLKDQVKNKLNGKVNNDDIDKVLDNLWKKEGLGNLIRNNRTSFSVFGFLKFVRFFKKSKSYK